MSFVEGPVRVSVPATSANLGPGFDSLGLALSLRDVVTAEVTASGLAVSVSGEGAAEVPRDESHLVVRAMREGFRALGPQPPGLAVDCVNVIPHARGLGSSAAAIVAGLGAARALSSHGAEMDDDELFALAVGLEGHPDNVAPGLLGGFCVSGTASEPQPDQVWTARVPVDARVSAVVFVPADPVSTALARGLLPASVPHAQAAANAGRTALLVAALSGQPELLLEATRDFLHQEHRAPAMPATLELVRDLRREGFAAVVSGAGPTVLAFCVAREEGAVGEVGEEDRLADRCPDGWALHRLAVEADGLLELPVEGAAPSSSTGRDSSQEV